MAPRGSTRLDCKSGCMGHAPPFPDPHRRCVEENTWAKRCLIDEGFLFHFFWECVWKGGGGGEERVNRTVPWSAKTNASYQFGSLPSRSSFLQTRSLNSGLRRLTTLTQNSAVAYLGRCVYIVEVCLRISCMLKKPFLLQVGSPLATKKRMHAAGLPSGVSRGVHYARSCLHGSIHSVSKRRSPRES